MTVQEDDPGWDCETMGNRICGPDTPGPTTVPDCTFSSPEQAAPECGTTVLPSTSVPGTDSCDWLVNPPSYPECGTTTTAGVQVQELPVTGSETVVLGLLGGWCLLWGVIILVTRKLNYNNERDRY
jgi:hypothetical protein